MVENLLKVKESPNLSGGKSYSGETKSQFVWWIVSFQPANIGPQDVRRMSHSKVPRTSPKDPI